MKKQLLLTRMLLLVALLVGSTSVWAEETEVTFDFTTTGNYTINTSQKTITYGEVATFSYSVTGEDNCQKQGGIQWGASKVDAGTIIITTSAYSSYVIKQVDINATSTAGYNATVNVGSTSYTAASGNSAFGSTAHTNTYTGSSTGDIEITLSQASTKKNVNIKKIVITYEEASSVTSLSVKTAPTKVRYEVGENLSMTGFVLDADGTEVSSGYTMTMGGAAITDGTALNSAGKKTITVAYGGKTVDQAISVGSVTGIAVTTPPTKTSYDTGDSFDPTGMVVTASLSTGEAEDPDTWTKEVTGYTVDPEDDLAPANTYVTITYATKTATQNITVTNVAVTSVSVKASTTIEKTKTETLIPTFTPTNATNKNVSWESDDTSVATVTAAGVVTGVAAGTANITVTTEDGGYEATCVVTVVNQKGTIDYPYTVADVNTGNYSGTKYVLGYIVGYFNGKDSNATTTGTSSTVSNVALSDSPSEISGAKTIAVQLPSGTIRNNWNIYNNSVKGYKVLVCGSIEAYFSGKTGVKSPTSITGITATATISAAGYATFSSTQKLDFTGVEGLTAYKATTTGESSVTLEEVTGIVPAETGLMLKGDADTYYIPVSTADPTANVDNNLLQSVATSSTGKYTVTGEETGTAYVFGKFDDTEVGFFKAATGKTIGVGKSWLLVPGTGAKDVEFLSFVFGDEEQGETDGIKAVSTNVENGVRYNLAGQKVGADYKGIVIVNGKKVIIK